MNFQGLRRPRPEVIVAVAMKIAERLGARVSTSQAILEQHSHGERLPAIGMPDLRRIKRLPSFYQFCRSSLGSVC